MSLDHHRPLNLEHFVHMGRVGEVALEPGGRWLAVSVSRPDARTGRLRASLWRVPVDGGAATCLVEAEHHARSPAFDHRGRLLFLGERCLEEEGEPRQDQVLRLGPEGIEPLTDAPRGVSAFRVARQGDRLAWLEPHRPDLPLDAQRAAWLREQRHGPGARHFRRQPVRYWKRWLGRDAPLLRVADAMGGKPVTVAGQDPRELFEGSWALSEDGRRLALTRNRPAGDRLDDTTLWCIDLETGTERLLDDGPGVRWSQLVLCPAGRRLAAVRHQRQPGQRGPEELWTHDLESGQARRLLAAWDRWPEPVGWAGDELVVQARDEVCLPLWAVHADTEALRPVVKAGVVEGRQVHGRQVVVVQHDLGRPPAPAVIELDRPALRRLEAARGDEPGPRDPCTVHEHRAALPGGEAVHYLVVRPADAPADAPLPVLFWIHGGPVSHWADWWHWRWNAGLFASYGYAVVLPNPRGSTGYGQDWVEGIWNNRWGEQCVQDLLAVLADLPRHPGLDLDRLAALGASFGGWMVNRLGGLVPDFRCIVSHAGIFDDRAFAGGTDMPPYWHWEHAGAPWTDPEHDRWSPHRVIAGWRAPTLVVHGELDYRVPLTEGLALFEALLHHGVEAELLAFPDEGHWIERPGNVLCWHQHVLGFLARHLGGSPPTPPLPPAHGAW